MLCSFAWIVERELAGSGQPGLLAEIEEDLEFIDSLKIGLVVTLTERAPPVDWARRGIEHLHFPIPDMGIPMPRRLEPVCQQINNSATPSSPVLVHCRAGLGRTGLVLASCLVERGLEPARAIQRLRALNPRYIQTTSQERFIEHYATFIGGRRGRDGAAHLDTRGGAQKA